MIPNTWLTQLERRCGCTWPAIARASAESEKTRNIVVAALKPLRFENQVRRRVCRECTECAAS